MSNVLGLCITAGDSDPSCMRARRPQQFCALRAGAHVTDGSGRTFGDSSNGLNSSEAAICELTQCGLQSWEGAWDPALRAAAVLGGGGKWGGWGRPGCVSRACWKCCHSCASQGTELAFIKPVPLRVSTERRHTGSPRGPASLPGPPPPQPGCNSTRGTPEGLAPLRMTPSIRSLTCWPCIGTT